MKRIFILLFLPFVMNCATAQSQEEAKPSPIELVFGSENPTKKEIKRAFRKLHKLAPDRATKKMLRSKEKEYIELFAKDQLLKDSIDQQRAKVERLEKEVEASEKLTKKTLEELRAENDSLELVMRSYVRSIDSLNNLNLRLEDAYENTGDYYFNLADFVEPKIYFFENTTYPIYSEYWRIYSIPDSNILVTEGFNTDFEQFNTFTEQYDSIGSNVIRHTNDASPFDSKTSEIGPTEVYRWSSEEEYTYTLNYAPADINYGYTKQRRLAGVATMEVFGEMVEVIRFEDKYTFSNKDGVSFVRMQQSFYSKKYGLVRYVQFDEVNKENEPFVLTKVLSEEEWLKLQE